VTVETVLLFALAAVAVTVLVRWVADRTGMPAAALLTIVGIGYALLPGPNITLEPDVVLTFVLPPLLYSAALDSSLLAIRRNLRTVVSLSVVLVLVTALAIGVAFEVFVAGGPWPPASLWARRSRPRLRASTQPFAATAGVLAARPCASTSTVPPGIYRGPDDCEHDVVIDVGGGSVERRSRALSGHRCWSRPRLPARGSQLRTQREHNVDPIVTGEDGRVVTPESRGRLAR